MQFFSFFLFRQLRLDISDSLHLLTLFRTDFLKKCQTKSIEMNTLLSVIKLSCFSIKSIAKRYILYTAEIASKKPLIC